MAAVADSAAFALRPMHADDLPQVMKLERQMFTADAWSTSLFRDELRAEGRYYVAAVEGPEPQGGAVVGYAGLRAVPPEGDVQTIAVAQAKWSTGIGTALLAELLEEAGRRGLSEVFLDVRADNPRAQRLYRRFGFTEIGLRRGYYRDGVDSLVMRRRAAGQEGVDSGG